MNKNEWFLNGGRGSGKTFRLLCETYENKIANLQHTVDTLQGYLDHDIEYDMGKTIQELRKENAELKCECRRCVYTDCPCILSDYGKDRNGICDHFKDILDENMELKDELKKWKDEWQEQVQKATDEGYARTLQTIQLTKAKEIIKKLLETPRSIYGRDEDGELTSFFNSDYEELKKQAEQFIKDSEVEK